MKATAVLPTSIWRDPEFTNLSGLAQWVYLMLSTQRGLTSAGCQPLALRRWSSRARGAEVASIQQGLVELDACGWVWTDYDTEEVLIRQLIPPAGHKHLQGALQATLEIQSPRLRSVAVNVLLDCGHDGRRAARGSNHGFHRMRLRVHQRDGYACLRCSWTPEVPATYDGGYALGAVYLDATDSRYRVRILELDHIYPDSLGGKFEFENLQTLCNSCNASKGARV